MTLAPKVMTMKTISTLVAALACATAFGLHATAAPSSRSLTDVAAQPRAGDGGSLPGLPGGRGGAAGNAAQASDDTAALMRYCIGVLEPRRATRNSNSYGPVDCADYFTSLDEALAQPSTAPRASRKDAADGASIAGGIGGRGGRHGTGAGGGLGGAGGAGLAGGLGGRGGAGGAAD